MNWLQRLLNIRTLKKTRAIWHVDGTNGDDAYAGNRPEEAFQTIGAAVTAASAGDLIKVAEDTYDEAVVVPAGLAGLEIICEPGTILIETTPGTVVSIAAPHAKLEGCLISQAGAIGLAVAGAFFRGKDIIVDGCTTGFDLDGANPRLTRCISKNHTVTGFDISEDSGVYIKVFAIGTGAVTGFDLSHTNAELNTFLDCHSLNNTANGFNLILGADSNTFINCSQSSLCGGPADGGANNSWINWSIESQITAGQSIQEDLSDLKVILDTSGTLVNARSTAYSRLVGIAQIAATTIDLDNTAIGTYNTLIGTLQNVIIESLIFRCTRDLSGDAGFTGISLQTNDTTKQVFVSEANGVKVNLTADSQLAWTGAILLKVGQYIDFSVYGGAVANLESLCDIVVTYRAVVAGGCLA